jgi:transposase InsO family protein
MREHKNQYRIREMTGVFGVSSSAYYRWAEQGVRTGREERDAELPELIREIVVNHHFRYGSPRVREALRNSYGIRISRKKTARLMRENGLNARRRGKFIPTTNSNHGLEVCENLLKGEFQAEKGGEKWVSDILRTLGGWVYLTVILDLYDRKVVGWALSADMEACHTAIPAWPLTTARPWRACSSIPTGGYSIAPKVFVIVCMNTVLRYARAWDEKGNCWDNACAGTFFKTLKREWETLDGRHTAGEVRQSVFMYLEAIAFASQQFKVSKFHANMRAWAGNYSRN